MRTNGVRRLWLVAAAVLLAVLVGGCAGNSYLLESSQAKAEIATQIEVILAEYNAAATTDLSASENATFEALKASIKATPKEADAKIDKARALLTTINEKRAQEAERAVLSARLLAFLRKLSAQDATIVIRQTNDVDQLRDLVEQAWTKGSGK